jgi:predicted GNAT family N-acyltransferase
MRNKISIKTVTYTDNSSEIKALRVQVFQIGQGVAPEIDFDGKDETAEHLLAYLDNQPVGTARITYLAPKTAKIERLAVLSTARGLGIGKKLMEKAVEVAAQNDVEEVVIHAQEYVKSLHQKVGFEQVGERFDEAGIPHVKMIKRLK